MDSNARNVISQTSADGAGGGAPLPHDWRHRATVTVPQSAAILGISRSAAYEAIRAKQLPGVTIGRRVLVPVGPLLRMLDAGDNGA
jgi:excisionase family DNA binding protein